MNNYAYTALTLGLVIILMLKKDQGINTSPVIGIMIQPSQIKNYPSTTYDYLASSYVKFVEAAGGRVIPIPYTVSDQVLDTLFDNINGLIIPGGATKLEGPSNYTKKVAYLINKAITYNNNGSYFPIMGICLGHELIHYVLSDYDSNFKIPVVGEDRVTRPINVQDRQSKLFKDMEDALYQSFTNQNMSYYHHVYAISDDLYNRTSIKEKLRITAYNTDQNNITYIASAVGIQHPIITVQYHPEKNPFEWTVPANHSKDAIKISQHHGNVFLNMARQNNHSFQLQNLSIYNFQPVIPESDSYSQVYFFNKNIWK